jgi:hypothetical protein
VIFVFLELPGVVLVTLAVHQPKVYLLPDSASS